MHTRGESRVSKRADVLKKTADAIRLIHAEMPDDVEGLVSDTVRRFRDHVNPGFLQYRKSVSTDYTAVEWADSGVTFIDAHGREFIDCLGGYGIYNVGHRHPALVAAVTAQLGKQALHSQELLDPLRGILAELVADLTPGDIQYAFFTNSGTEAVEGALKLARIATGRFTILATTGGFHGKSLGALSATAKGIFRQPFLPLVPGVRHVPFGDLAALRATLFAEETVGTPVAAILVEPIQGEGGIILPPPGYLEGVRAAADEFGALVIFDEVQTGMGRTGRLWASEHWGVVPDIMCLGKAFGGGVMPIGAFAAPARLWEPLMPNPFLHSTTFGGNPLACAAAIAGIHVLLEEGWVDHARDEGAYLLEGLSRVAVEYPDKVAEVRGRGLMIGVELTTGEIGYEVATALFREGVLVAGTLVHAKTLRFEPPLPIGRAVSDQIIERFRRALAG